MTEEKEKKSSNPINIINIADGKNINKLNSSRDNDNYKDKDNPKKENLNHLQNSSQGIINNTQDAHKEKNFGSENKDFRTNLSTNQNFNSNQQYYTNSNLLKANN
jgi:hypothetical protein